MAAFHVRVPGLVRFLLLIAASTAVLALPSTSEEREDLVKVDPKAKGGKIVVDYRYNKCMPPIATEFLLNTEKCLITFWALTAVAMVEYVDCMSSPKKVLRHFSAEQVLECALPDHYTSCGTPNVKKVTDALDYITYAGIALNDTYNEVGISRSTLRPDRLDTCQANKVGIAYRLKKGYQNLMPFDEANMARQIRKTGPILATLYLDVKKLDKAEYYSSGFMDSDTVCLQSLTGYSYTKDVTTATEGGAYPVMVVGYGTMDGVKMWILRSDWLGDSWGMGGYFYLKRGVNACNIALNPIQVLG